MTTASRNLRLPKGRKASGFDEAPITEQAVGGIEHEVQAWFAELIARAGRNPTPASAH